MIGRLVLSKGGEAIPDHQAENYATMLRSRNLRVSTENVVHAARILIKRGILDYKTVEFCIEDDKANIICIDKCDRDGRMNEFWSMFDTHFGFLGKWLAELL